MPDRLVYQKHLIYWDFCSTAFSGFESMSWKMSQKRQQSLNNCLLQPRHSKEHLWTHSMSNLDAYSGRTRNEAILLSANTKKLRLQFAQAQNFTIEEKCCFLVHFQVNLADFITFRCLISIRTCVCSASVSDSINWGCIIKNIKHFRHKRTTTHSSTLMYWTSDFNIGLSSLVAGVHLWTCEVIAI